VAADAESTHANVASKLKIIGRSLL